ncbi:hypothetical protein BP6252_08184 [Coleophoma cylindrospora]|uniref:HTH APSES-type domain-containing protein n=1 Tax=Coleophoma cylindrospora TaxID=1849047 RepID=A0A3D8RCK0_9HELO|nr:hypothetical protein BP6252_08184 [Coleophoma cylindrospora]
MVKPTAPGVYSATYSNIPVYEYQFGENLKEHVMRRRHDDWINATHILKAAGFDKPARTRILEREVQKELHEKVQGGYGKYQGTWVPLEQGKALAWRSDVYEKLSTIFEFTPGNISPPPAPKHTTNKPKVPKKPAVPKWSNKPAPAPRAPVEENYDNISAQLNDDETPDDTTVASASFMDDDDRYDMSQPNTGHRKRKRDEEPIPNPAEQAHVIYSDELLDYFMMSHDQGNIARPEPPPNFQPDWIIDSDAHTAMHWASAMGDVEIMKQLKRFGANLAQPNVRGETPLMRAVLFTNCQDKQSMPAVVRELIGTIDVTDYCQATALHHAAMMNASKQKHHCARYYLDIIINKCQEMYEPDHVQQILDAQDVDGNTALHIAAKFKARKCVRALMGRGASCDIANQEGVTAEELIQELNDSRRERFTQASSSPFAPDSQRHDSYNDPLSKDLTRLGASHHSEAAMSIESKITPAVLEKFQDLAKSFDEELIDRGHSEREAKRILTSTQVELAIIREQLLEIDFEEQNAAAQTATESAEFEHLHATVVNLVEQQQQLRLLDLVANEEMVSNGHVYSDSPQERLMLAQRLNHEQERRQKLVSEFILALSMAGGENGEVYRKLISNCVGIDVETIDEGLDDLLEQLEADQQNREMEVVTADA